MNQATLIGTIHNEPQTRTLSNGQQVTNCTMTTYKSWTDKEGNKRESTEYHNLQFWGQKSAMAQKYVHMGMEMFAQGEIKTRSYENKDGIKKSITEINVEHFRVFGLQKDEGFVNKARIADYDDVQPF